MKPQFSLSKDLKGKDFIRIHMKPNNGHPFSKVSISIQILVLPPFYCKFSTCLLPLYHL